MNVEQLLQLTAITGTTFLVLLFVISALHKLADVERFSGYILNYELIPAQWIKGCAYGLLGVEGAISFGLIIPSLNAIATAVAIALLGLYAVAMLINIKRGNVKIECGCGGPLMYLSYKLIMRNLLIILLALPALFSGHANVNTFELCMAVSCGVLLFLILNIAEKLLANFHHSQIKVG
jgi:hypothetical protein